MKKFGIVLLMMVLILVACKSDDVKEPVVETSNPEIEDSVFIEKGIAFFDLYIEKNFEGAYEAGLDQTMKSAFKPDTMASVFAQIETTYGDYKERVGELLSNSQGFIVVSIGTHHTSKDLIYNVVFNESGEIAGFHFNEATTLDDFTSEPAIESNENGKAVLFGKAPYELEGTLLLPEGQGPFPAVILVHGSGPNDRDETIYQNKPFKDIAEGLVERGIAVLRYDKRTYTHASQLTDPEVMDNFTIYDETIDDAGYAVEYLKTIDQINVNRIVVLGHSLGGNQAPRIASQNDSVAGIIILGGNVSPLQKLMLDQYHYLAEIQGTDEASKKVIEAQMELVTDAISKIEAITSPDDFSAEELLGVPARYWMDLIHYNPTEIASDLDIPILILQGERDYQVPPSEFELWKSGLGDQASYGLYPDLNHLFMPGEGKSSPEEYAVPGHVSVEVIQDISDWINEKIK